MPKQFFILFLEFFKQIKKKPLEENPIAKYWEINVFKNSSLKSVFFFKTNLSLNLVAFNQTFSLLPVFYIFNKNVDAANLASIIDSLF